MSGRSSKRLRSASKQKTAKVKVEERVEIPPLAHLHYQGDRHLHPQRLPSAKREVPVSLRLLDTKPQTVENVTKIGRFLKRVTLCGLRLTTVPAPLLDCLTSVEKLDLSENRLHDASIPEDFKSMDSLIELTLSNNKIARVPSCLKKMKNLTRLDLSHNKLDSLKGLDKIKRLQVLVVEHNMLSSFVKDIHHMKKLETLCCAHNNLREVHPDVRHLKTLREIDLSNNKISMLNPELILLPRLELLNVSNNRISKIPSFTVKLLSRHWVHHIDLSDNTIARFPEHLLLFVKNLDLSGNKIKLLQSNVLKKMDWNTDQELNVQNNPLAYPPVDVCNSGLRSIIQFFQEVKADSKVHQGVKVIVLGCEKSGKSSLVQSFIDQQARLEENSQSSCGIDCYETSIDQSDEGEGVGVPLHMCLWDFGGHPAYFYPHSIFLEHPSVTLLTFNMAAFTPETFREFIATWFEWMICQGNSIVTVVVGTQSDRLRPSECETVKTDAENIIKRYIRNRKKQFETEIKKIESRPHISATYSELLKNYVHLLNASLLVHTSVVTTSAAKYSGFKELQEAIIALADNREFFPNFKQEIPTFWIDVEHFLEDKGNFMAVPVMAWPDYEELVTQKFGMKHLLKAITQYLHESGKVIWFSKINSLKKYVFLRPSWLFEVFRYVFRYDIGDESKCPMDWLKRIGLSSNRIERAWKELIDEGIVERDFIKGMLGPCVPHDLNQPFLQVLNMLIEGFGIGYPVQKKMKEGAYNLTVEPDADGKVKLARVLLPWYRKNPEPASVTEHWMSLSSKPKVVALYNFHNYMPPGVFETFVVRVNGSTKSPTLLLSHWGGGIYAQHPTRAVQVLVTHNKMSGRSATIKFDVRDVSDAESDSQKNIWEVLLPILMLFEEILQGFSGTHCYI